MKILIVGASGYIGSNLTLYLSSKGHKVFAGVRKLDGNRFAVSNVAYLEIDLTAPETYRDVLRKIDVIFYLVGPGSLLMHNNTIDLIKEYLASFAIFLEENSKINNSPVIYSSSGGAIYGAGSIKPFHENDKLNPCTPYGLLKVLSENLLQYYHSNYLTPFITLRISNPYGGVAHNKLNQAVINIFIKKIFTKQKIEVWGDGSSTRDYIFIDDLMLAYEAALFAKKSNSIVNIGSGVGTSVMNICKIIESYINQNLEICHLPKKPEIIDYVVLDITFAKCLLGWAPAVPIVEGITRAVEDYQL